MAGVRIQFGEGSLSLSTVVHSVPVVIGCHLAAPCPYDPQIQMVVACILHVGLSIRQYLRLRRCRELSFAWRFAAGTFIFLRWHVHSDVFISAEMCGSFRGGGAMAVGLLLLGGKIFLALQGSRFDVIMRDLSIPFLLLVIWRAVPSDCLRGACAFPLYVMHILFFPYVDVIITRIIPQIAPEMLAGIRFFVGVSASLVVAKLLCDYCPRLSGCLFGNRIYKRYRHTESKEDK